MKTKLFTLFVAIVATTALWASNVITYTAREKLTRETLEVGATTFGSAITSHTYNDGTGTITCESEVTTIGGSAFNWCEGLTSITIPNSVTTIGDRAFSGCYGLTSVTIPNSVTTIGYMAFAWCEDLTSVTIGNSVTTIGDDAFAYCTGLTSITIPNSVTTIGEGAFRGCYSLTSVTIPNSVTTIGDYAFYNVNNIVYNGTATGSPWGAKCVNGYVDGYLVYSDATKTTLCGCSSAATGEIVIPNSVTTIGEYAFEYCSGLTSITIPNSVTTIGDYAFYACTSLTSITIPNSVTTIGYMAFFGCSGLTSVTIPNSVTTIGEYAFEYCSGLTSPIYNTTIFAYMPESYSGAYTIPNGIEQIAGGAFAWCEGLTSVTIPNSVTTIGRYTFYGCTGLNLVTIPNSVTTIGDYAFYRCGDLTSITCYAVIPPKCGDDVFYNINQDAKVYVPASALTDYQNAEGWKDLQLYPIAAEVTPMDDENPVVTPTDQDVTITWPITDGTDTYTITISKNGEVVCVLTFNAQGQLQNITFAAPGRDGAHQAPAATLTAQGYQFTVTGLNPGTAYNYSVTAADAGGKTLAEYKGNFSTTGGTGLNTLPYEGKDGIGSKYFHNGNLIIERNGVKYTPAGQKVR